MESKEKKVDEEDLSFLDGPIRGLIEPYLTEQKNMSALI